MEDTIIEKIKLDIDERKISYQKELQKIKEEKNLLGYIKGILEITKNNVSNFPYYDSDDLETADAALDFDVMLKYTLKEDSIIASFKSEIKNLYYLEKIGYKHAEQYLETKAKLEEYHKKIEAAYQELIANDTLKKVIIKHEEVISKLDYLKDKLEADEELRIDEVASFYKCLQCANLSEKEKTSILVSMFEKNIDKEQSYLNNLHFFGRARKIQEKKFAMTFSEQELSLLQNTLLNCLEKIENLPIIIHFPITRLDNKVVSIDSRKIVTTSVLDDKAKKILNIIKNPSNKKTSTVGVPRFLLVDNE